jgi:hypothetical protein
MIAARLIRLIENHSDHLAAGLTQRLRDRPETADYIRVPASELTQRAYDLYHNLSDWLLTRSDAEIENRYTWIGRRRAQQGVALSSMVYALATTKEYLWEFIKREAVLAEPVELHQELELFHLVEYFFDRATYFAVRGYENARAARAA